MVDKKIDQLQGEVSDIQKSLNELKSVTLSEADKKTKTEEIKNKAETTKQAIQSKIDKLKDKTDADSVSEREKAETLLKILNDIITLQLSIGEQQGNKPKDGATSTGEKPSETTASTGEAEGEKKGFFGKIGDGLSNMWNDVTTRDKWKEQPGKNLLYLSGTVVTGVALYKGVKKLWNWAFGEKKKEESGGKSENDSKEDKSKESDSKKEDNEKSDGKTSRRRKFLIGTGIATGTVVGGVSIYKNWNRISSWVKEKLGKALNFDEAMYSVEAEVRNGINSDNNFGEFSAHFEGMSYDENTQEISSFGQKTKINKSNKSIEGMDDVQFASWEELFHAVNIVNFAKRELRGRGDNKTPFTVNKRTGDIDFTLSEAGKNEFISANGSNFWTWVLGLGGAGGGGLLGGYFLGLKGGLAGAVGGGLAGYTLGSVIDNTSTMGRTCGTIAKGANLQKFVNYLNSQNIWGEQKEEYEADNTTPIHKYLNKVKREIDEAYPDGSEDSARRDLRVERNESSPDIYKIKSYYKEITLKLDGCTAKRGENIDFSKIKKIHIEKYEKIGEEKIESRGDGLDIDFPHTEEGIEEAIRTANLTNKIVNDRRGKGGEKYPFAYNRYVSGNSINNLDIDTPGTGSNRQGGTCVLRNNMLSSKYPTILKDLRKYPYVRGLFGVQKEMHEQAVHDKPKGSQYIKFLHQIGKGKYWKK